MINTKTSHSSRHSHDRALPVRFEYHNAAATTVSVVGSFNQWRSDATAMQSSGGGLWQCEAWMPAGTYEYRLIVDGLWLPDPLVNETVPNPYGGRNSILKVGESAVARHLLDATNTPFKSNKKY